jgi:hypothetical protein
VAQESDAMIVCAFVLKPDAILPSFRDRIRVRNAVSAMAWPYHVHINNTRGARPRTEPERDQRRWQWALPEDHVSVTINRRLLWKVTCRAIWQCEIKSSMP